MTNESTHPLNQDLVVIDPGADRYDPLADDNFDEQKLDDSLEVIGYIGDPSALAPKTEIPPVPEKTPREKIDDLLSNMIPCKRYLLSIMEFCKEPRDFAQLDTFVSELQTKRTTIYHTAEFCLMLENAEALSKIVEDGTPYDEIEIEPVEVERDGQVFLEPGSPPPVFWRTTEAGLQVLEEDDPITILQKIFEDEAEYTSVFLQILELCDQDGGISISDMRDTVDKNPVLDFPRKATPFFLDYLDRNAAVVWDNNWKITSVGKQALELLRLEPLRAEGDA
jgi:hypothetical protein